MAARKQRTVEAELKALREDRHRLEQEVFRLQALYRMTQRAVGVQPDKKPSKPKVGKSVKTRRVRRQSRGERVLASLRSNVESSESKSDADTLAASTSSSGGA